jgi:hypothetical protein
LDLSASAKAKRCVSVTFVAIVDEKRAPLIPRNLLIARPDDSYDSYGSGYGHAKIMPKIRPGEVLVPGSPSLFFEHSHLFVTIRMCVLIINNLQEFAYKGQ